VKCGLERILEPQIASRRLTFLEETLHTDFSDIGSQRSFSCIKAQTMIVSAKINHKKD
jgi:hypothetical protein